MSNADLTPKISIQETNQGDSPMRLLKKIECAFDKIVPISELKPNPRNPNQHPKKQIKMLAQIISQSGWRAPITVSTRSGFIVRGHGRLLAAQELGLDSAPVDYQDYESDAAELADLIADNKIQELSALDDSILAPLLLEIPPDWLAAAGVPNIIPLETMPELPTGDKSPFQQMTFTLHDSQAEQVKAAMDTAKGMGEFVNSPNENSNGNALARICETFSRQNGNG